MNTTVTIRRAMEDPNLLGATLAGPSWATWRMLLAAAMGERLRDDETESFRALTGRSAPPARAADEVVVVAGRRAGKTRAMAALAVYLAGMRDYTSRLARGERAVVLIIAPDTRQARVLLDYAVGMLEATPVLAQLVAEKTADTLSLTTGIDIKVRAASFRRLRGLTAVAILADEACFWSTEEDGANPDSEILNAVRPMLATTGGPLVIISSPYARRGEVYEMWRAHHGDAGDPAILVAQGASRDFNPSLPEAVVRRAMERDPAAARAEYLGLWRDDVETFVAREAVEACVEAGRRERSPRPGITYLGFVDPSGGGQDSMTLAVAHHDGGRLVLDAVREARPPFSPESVVADFAGLLAQYRVRRIVGDRYAGEWPREAFRRHGVTYDTSERTKSDIYRDLLPRLNSGDVALLDDDRLKNQLSGLERRVARGGRDTIDHGPGGHDDLANAAAGALMLASDAVRRHEVLWGGVGATGGLSLRSLNKKRAWHRGPGVSAVDGGPTPARCPDPKHH
ncbi:terminase family protein [Methylopila sp. 73B]|uniref:terminase large subunit domain-containing protein n=1 Tax=Methylopila sp. 73B TaxID=1120792 RepID=UPI00036B5D66|nr:terminase family protein [Methylopila sp. 73B]